MTILVISDLQLADNPRDAYRFDLFPWLHEAIAGNDVEQCFILGDLTEEKDNHGAGFVNRVVDEMTRLAGLCSVTLLRGNHDYVKEDAPFFRFLNHIPKIKWVDDPTPLPPSADLGAKAIMLPHALYPADAWKHLGLEAYKLIFCHQTIGKVAIGKGQTVTGIDDKLLPAKAHIFAGDVHVPMTVGRITYVGAPYTVDFGDDYVGRALLFKKGGFFSSLPIPMRQKRLLNFEANAEGVDWSKADLGATATGDIVKIRLAMPSRSVDLYKACRAEIIEWAYEQGLDLAALHPTFPLAAQLSHREQDKERSAEQWVRYYAKLQKLDKDLLQFGLKIVMGD